MINPDNSRITGLYTGSRQKRCPTCGQVIGGGGKFPPGEKFPPGKFPPGKFPGFPGQKPGIGQPPVMGDRPPPNSPLMYTQVMPPEGMKYVYNQQTGERSTVPISGRGNIPRPKPTPPGQRPGFPGGRPGRPLPGRLNPWKKKFTGELFNRKKREGNLQTTWAGQKNRAKMY